MGVRGRPPIKWENRVLEYLRERVNERLKGIESARVKCTDRSKWRQFCRGRPVKEFREQASE